LYTKKNYYEEGDGVDDDDGDKEKSKLLVNIFSFFIEFFFKN
jgi:hypothetical protein